MSLRNLLISLLLVALFSISAGAVQTFPYLNLSVVLPGHDNPYPGLGAEHAALGDGIRTVQWNPASLGKIKSAEGYFGVTTTALTSSATKEYKVHDTTFEVSGTGTQSVTGFVNQVIFTGDTSGTFLATREFMGNVIYTPQSSGMDYKQAIRVADWFSLGISSRGETNIGLDVAGEFPAQYLSNIDLYGVNNFMNSGMSVTNGGKLTYAFNPSGMGSYVYTSEAAVWGNFLKQSNRVPFSVVSDMHDSLNVKSSLTFTGATNWNGLYAGLNFTPISATMNIDNTASMVVKDATADPYFYAPNFDPNDQADVFQWMNDPNRYGTAAGYQKNYIRVPAGESVAEAKYTGFYQAASVKTDLGFMYDLGQFATIGVALENFGGADLNFKGTGRVAYVNTRINTGDATSIITPGSSTVWSPFTDTFQPVKGTENIGMLPEINLNIPRRTKIGIAIRKPILITFDYEVQNTPITFRTTDSNNNVTDITLSNIRILRGGAETQVFFLPLWLRGNAALLWKPDEVGMTAEQLNSYNKMFMLGSRFMPMSVDLGLGTNLWGYVVDASGGFNGSNILSMYQADTMNTNFARLLYYTLALKKDNWYFSLENTLDPGATATAYNNAPESEKKSNDPMKLLGLVKWISTFTFGFKF